MRAGARHGVVQRADAGSSSSVPSPGGRKIEAGGKVFEFRTGKIKLPRIYVDITSEFTRFVVTDFANTEDEPLEEINRMCNAMAICWVKKAGPTVPLGFWQFSAAEQNSMAQWVADDQSPQQQNARAETELGVVQLDGESFVEALTGAGSATGLLGSDSHAMGFVVKAGRVCVYDPMEGEIVVNDTVATFLGNFGTYAATYAWSTFLLGL